MRVSWKQACSGWWLVGSIGGDRTAVVFGRPWPGPLTDWCFSIELLHAGINNVATTLATTGALPTTVERSVSRSHHVTVRFSFFCGRGIGG